MLQQYFSDYKFSDEKILFFIFFSIKKNMIEMNSIRNQRLSSIFYMEIAEILMKDETKKGFLITLIKICMTPDLSLIKSYISIYPFLDKEILESIRSKSGFYRKLLSKKLRYRVKKIPELDFCVVNSRN